MKKYLAFLFLAFVVSLNANAQYTYEELQNLVAELNAQMPISTGFSMQLNSAELTPQAMIISCSINSAAAEDIQVNEQTLHDNTLNMLTGNEDVEPLFESLIDLNIGLIYKYSYNAGKDEVSVAFTPSELRDILNKELSPEDKTDIIISGQKNSLPIKMAEGLTLVDVRKANDYVETIMDIDETLFDISQLEQNQQVMKETMVAGMKNDAVSIQQMQVFSAAGYGIKYIYRGTVTHKQLEIMLSKQELLDLIEESEQ